MSTALHDAIHTYLTSDLLRFLEHDKTGSDSGDKSPHRPRRTFLITSSSDFGVKQGVRLTLDEAHEFDATGFVFDEALHSIGIIQFVQTSPGAASELIDQAASLAHLLSVRDPRAHRAEHPFVELVLVVDSNRDASLLESLHTAHASSTLLHAVSIHVIHLPGPAENKGDKSENALKPDVQRAFCWLLPSVKKWFAKSPPQADASAPWDTLSLVNFRCEGTRSWVLAKNAQFHLLHGSNGSGKTSLAEGFEFAVTGDCHSARERWLEATPTSWYESVLCRKVKDGPVKATLLDCSRPNSKPTIQSEASWEPSKTTGIALEQGENQLKLDGRSFHLDQGLANQLIGGTLQSRAQHWFEVFFQHKDKGRQARQTALKSLRTLLARILPKEQQEQRVLQVLDIIQSSNDFQSLSYRLLNTLFPSLALAPQPAVHPSEFQLALSRLIEELASLTKPSSATTHNWFHNSFRKNLESAFATDLNRLAGLDEESMLAMRAVLEQMGQDSFRAERSDTLQTTNVHDALNEWLRGVATLELFRSALRIRKVCAPSRLENQPRLEGILPRLSTDELAHEVGNLESQLQQLRTQLDQAFAERNAGTRPALPVTSPAHSNRFVEWVKQGFFAPALVPEDAPSLVTAFKRRQIVQLRDLQIGAPGWTNALVPLVDQRLALFQCLAFSRPSHAVGPHAPQSAATWADWFIEFLVACAGYHRLMNESANKFFAELKEGALGDALRELVDLMTPARWAYPGLNSSVTFEDNEDRVELQAYDMDAVHVLNTAELNTISLAIFLLCAPTAPNPFRTIILDDPLQNMDELTVTGVGRALARLARIWNTDNSCAGQAVPNPNPGAWSTWKIILLLNSIEHCERLRDEVPFAFYEIPWLRSPDIPNSEQRIERHQDDPPFPAPTARPSAFDTFLKVKRLS